LSKISSHVIHRMRYENLLDLHNLLITLMFAESTGNKRPYQEDHVPSFAPQASVTPYHPPMKCESDPEAAPTYSRANFPDIKFWTKEEFMEFEAKRKDLSDPMDQPGPCGRTRCAQGENVTMLFIEQSDGRAVSGMHAGDIRYFARSLWKDLYARGLAPETWGDAPRSIQDEYAHKMEKKWPILHYCENHWKVHHLTTKMYPGWYKGYHKKKSTGKGKDIKGKGPALKRRKTMVEDDDTGNCQTNPETDTVPDGSDDDHTIALPSWLKEDVCKGSSMGTSRPKARHLRDPL